MGISVRSGVNIANNPPQGYAHISICDGSKRSHQSGGGGGERQGDSRRVVFSPLELQLVRSKGRPRGVSLR